MRKIPPIFAFFTLFSILPLVVSAQNKIDSLVSVLKIAKEDTNKVKTLQVLAGLLRNKPQEAMKYLNEALALAQKLNDKMSVGKAYQNISTVYSDQRDLNKSIEYSNKALQIFGEINSEEGIARTRMNMGVTYGKAGKTDEALREYFKALEYFKKMNRNDGIAFCANNIGSEYKKSGDPKQALKYHLMALEARKINGIKGEIVMSYRNIGSVYQDQGDYAKALNNFLIALKIAEEVNDKFWIAETYLSLGSCYFYLENYEEALKYFKKNLSIVENVGDKKRIADAYNNLGSIYTQQEKFEEALKNHQRALKIREEVGDKYGISTSYLNIGATYKQQENYEEALKNLFLAVKIKEDIKDQSGLAMAFINIGSIYTVLNKFNEAASYLAKSLALSKQQNNKELIFSAYNNLVFLDSTSGNFANAYINYKYAIQYKDSLENKETTEQITRLQMQFDFDKKEDSLRYQQAFTDEKLKQQTLLAQQQQQSLLLKMKELSLISKEKELQKLAYLKSQADLQAEQSKRKENEGQLTIAEQEKILQKTKLDLQATQLGLQDKEIMEKKTQRNIFIAGSIALLLLAFFIFRNFQNQKKANQLIKVSAEKESIELQLQSLRAQLNPHFMFNSLNAIQELIVMDENEKSQSYLERFAKLLRMLLENANEPFISLRKEINLLELYLSLEKLRLPDLQYSIEMDPRIDPQEVMTPNMMLQPYVENALWHGLQHKQGEKILQLNIGKQNGSLEYEIRDNGVGRKKAQDIKSTYRKEHRSKGMELLSQRFNLLSKEYGQNIQSTITDLTNNGIATGTLVKITIPYSVKPEPKPVS